MMNAALHDICTRIARLETERKELAAEVAKIKKQAKEDGYDAGLITKTVAIMLKSGKKQREALEQHELFDTYLNAVGLLRDDQFETVESPAELIPIAAEDIEPGTPVYFDKDTGEVYDARPKPETDHAETVTTSPREGGETLEPGSPSTPYPASVEPASPAEGADDHSHRSAAGDDEPSLPPAGVVAGSFPDMPAFLDRRAGA